MPRVREVGKGRVVYFADDLYPAAASIRQAYEAELAVAAVEVEVQERATGWLRGSDDVNFAAYDRGGGQTRSLYLLNIDWWSGAASAPATLLLGDAEFKVEARAGQIEVITIASGVAAMPRDSEIDVMDVKRVGDGVELTTQAASPGQVDIFDGRSGDVQRVEVGPGICKRIIKQ